MQQKRIKIIPLAAVALMGLTMAGASCAAAAGPDNFVVVSTKMFEYYCGIQSGPYDKLHQNCIELFGWIEKEGYKITDSPRANYIDGIWNQEDPNKWLTIIQVPIEKA